MVSGPDMICWRRPGVSELTAVDLAPVSTAKEELVNPLSKGALMKAASRKRTWRNPNSRHMAMTVPMASVVSVASTPWAT